MFILDYKTKILVRYVSIILTLSFFTSEDVPLKNVTYLPTNSIFICCLTNNHAIVSPYHSRDGFTQTAENVSHLQELNTQRLEMARIKSWLEIPTPIPRCTFSLTHNIRPLPSPARELTMFRRKPERVNSGSLPPFIKKAGRSLVSWLGNNMKRKSDQRVIAVERSPEDSETLSSEL